MNETNTPFDWVKSVEASLLQSDNIPLFGGAPAFPWKEFNHLLSRTLEREDLKIEPSELRWRSSHELLAGVGENPKILNFVISPLEGPLCWAISEGDLIRLSAYLFSDAAVEAPFQDHDFLQGFHHFLAAEAMYAIDNLRFLQKLTPRLSENTEVLQTEALCQDVHITIQGKPLWGRLLISSPFLESWKEQFAPYKPTRLSANFLTGFDVNVAIQLGACDLNQEILNALKPGDFLLLDECTIDPETFQGSVKVTSNGFPAFSGVLKEGSVTLQNSVSSTSPQETTAIPPAEEAASTTVSEEKAQEGQEIQKEAKKEKVNDDDFDDDDDFDFDDDDDDDDFDFDDDDDDFHFDDDD